MNKKSKDKTLVSASLEELTKEVVKPIKDNTQKNLEFPLIKHEEFGEVIFQRIQDGYINATAMCKACGKEMKHYNELLTTKEFIEELSRSRDSRPRELVQTVRGGTPSLQGTWVHPQMAIHLGQWLSPKFAVEVSKWVFDWLSGKTPQSELPYHLKRYMMNMRRIPADHFSVLQEMTLVLIAPLEQQGYHLPSKMVPDISEGRIFAGFLRSKGVDIENMPKYMHKYEDGREVPATMYPSKYLKAFREHVSKIWLPERASKYFADRDRKALPFLDRIIQLGSPKTAKTIKED